MKKTVLFLLAFLCYSAIFSQTFNYQAVVRDAADAPVTNQSIGVLIAIRIGSPSGSIVYNEAHTVTSNNHGIITLPVGGGTSGANFLGIDWTQQNQWIEIRVDITGGTNYVTLGVSKLQHVPYALHALTSNSSTDAGPFDYTNNVVSNANGSIVSDDFVFGSSQLDVNGSFNTALNHRMFFDKSKAAIRAGYTQGDQWDESNVGDYSVGFGEGGIASGRNSFSMGRNANATGNESFAFGLNAGGFADYAKGFGLNARAFGQHATAIGRQVIANSMAEIQLGQYSTFVSGSADTWVPTDRLFVIGNGQEDINLALNSDALVMLKNGNTTLNGTLTIDGDNQGAGTAFTLPAQDGTINQIMSTDGAGNVSWVTPAAAAIPNGGNNGEVLSTDGSGALSWVTNDDADADPTNEIELPTQTGEDGKFLRTDGTAVSWQDVPNELPTGGTSGQVLSTDGSGAYSWTDQTANPAFSTANDITSNGNEAYGTNDFIFGAPTNETGLDVDAANRIFFDKNKAAFRVGRDIGLQDAFGDINVGAYSAAFGINPKAAGENSFAAGFIPNAAGRNSVAMGNTVNATGTSSVAMGESNTASGSYSVALGTITTAETYGQTTIGYLNTSASGNIGAPVATDRLFVIGNGTSDFNGNNNSDALVMLKSGNTTLNGELTIDGDNQGMGASYTLPAQDGTANQIMSTDGSGAVSWIDASSGGGSTLPNGGTNGQILSTDGNGVYSWVTDAVDDADADATNEIELPVGGSNGQVLATDGSGVYSWITDAVNDADADATNEIELPVGGSNGQVLATDGFGVYSWVDQTAMSNVTFATTANVTSNANGTIATDDFVFGSTQLADVAGTTNDDSRMFFDKSKSAFRAGYAFDDRWDDSNIGVNSIALGLNSGATEANTVAIGNSVNANRLGAVAIGYDSGVAGEYGVSLGSGNISFAKNEVVIGSYATFDVSASTDTWISSNRLFVIGNGTSLGNRSSALVMLKNGNTTLNGSLTIDGDNAGAGTSYTLPAQDGTANQVMSTNGSGTVSWINTPSDGDNDPTNEIELPVGGSNGQLLSTDGSGAYSWVTDADSDATNEIELPVGGTSGQVLRTDGSGGYSWTNNTVAPGAYTAAVLNSAGGWQYYNAAFGVTNFQDPRYRLVNNVVTLEGLCRKNIAISNGDTIMTLPVGFRPLKTRIFSVETENGSARVDVNPNGTVLIATGFDVNQNWVSLDGLTFSVD